MANATRQRGTVAVGKPITEDNKIPVTTKNLRKKKLIQLDRITILKKKKTYWLKKPSKPLPLRVEISPR